jgi:osomolarity two-component system sensor histidine kinase NIK1
VRSIAKVTKAVALGDLTHQIEVDARGKILDLKNTVNGMVVRYSHGFIIIAAAYTFIVVRALAAEVTQVTLEVGSQGKLGAQAHVPDVQGVYLNFVRNVSFFACLKKLQLNWYRLKVNRMCSSLTDQAIKYDPSHT